MLFGSLVEFPTKGKRNKLHYLYWGYVVSDPQNSEAFNKNRETGRKPNLDKTDTRNRKIESRDDSRLPPKDKKVEEKKNPEVVLKRQSPPTKPNRPPTGESGPGRPKPPSNESGPGRPKPAIKPPVKDESKVQQRFNRGTIQRNPMPAHQAVGISSTYGLYLFKLLQNSNFT